MLKYFILLAVSLVFAADFLTGNTKVSVPGGTDEEKLEVNLKFQDTNRRLFKYLFRGYNRFIPPVYTKRAGIANLSVDVPVKPDRDVFHTVMVYAKLLEVNAPKQLVTMIFEYSTHWKDSRLTWNPDDFDGINHIYVQREQVWVPELTPFDSTEVTNTRPKYKQHVAIAHTGQMGFYTSTLTSVTCHVDVLYFPFDTQNCTIELLSYTFYAQEIILSSELFFSIAPEDMGTEEWQVRYVRAHSEHPSGDDITGASLVNEFTFVLKRNPSYYVALIIFPSFVLTFLCILGLFSTPAHDGDFDKFSMGLTTMMSTTMMISIVTDNLPKTKILPHLCSFIIFNLGIVGLAILVVVYIPKIAAIVKWCMKRRGMKYEKGYRTYCSVLINTMALGFFEGLVFLNLTNLRERPDMILPDWTTIVTNATLH